MPDLDYLIRLIDAGSNVAIVALFVKYVFNDHKHIGEDIREIKTILNERLK